MNNVVSASPPTTPLCSSFQSKTQSSIFRNPVSPVPVIPRILTCSSNLKLESLSFGGARSPKRIPVQCNSSTKPGPPSGSGDGDSRTVLDAFFLGKAVAEALNERIESAVGEFLSTVGRLQAEQQKQVQEFQEDVFERAKKAKEKAVLEAMETRGLVPKSITVNATSVSGAAPTSPPSTNNDTPASPSDPITPDAEAEKKPEYVELMRRLGALGDGRQDRSTLSPDEWEVAYLYMALVLRKRGQPDRTQLPGRRNKGKICLSKEDITYINSDS